MLWKDPEQNRCLSRNLPTVRGNHRGRITSMHNCLPSKASCRRRSDERCCISDVQLEAHLSHYCRLQVSSVGDQLIKYGLSGLRVRMPTVHMDVSSTGLAAAATEAALQQWLPIQQCLIELEVTTMYHMRRRIGMSEMILETPPMPNLTLGCPGQSSCGDGPHSHHVPQCTPLATRPTLICPSAFSALTL
jgi:hypothetical protein